MDVRVTIPYTALLGADELPGDLAGYGPIPAAVARDLAAGGTWRRILTAKMLALSALVLAFIAVAVVHRRHLDAAKTLPQRQAYPPHVKPGW